MKNSLKQYKTTIMLGISGLFFLIFVVGIWAFMIPIKGAVIGSGQVSSKKGNRLLQHDTGGRVASLYVQEGDFVKKEQILVELSTEDSLLKRKSLTERFADLKARQIYLESKLENKKLLKIIDSPERFTSEELVLWNKILASYQALLTVEYEAHYAQIERIQQSLLSTRSQLYQSKEVVRENLNKKEFIEERIENFTLLEEKGVASKAQLLQLKISRSDINQNLASSRARLIELEGKIKSLNAELSALEKQRENQIQEQLLQTKTELSTIGSQRLAEIHFMERSILRSPINGQVFNLAVNTIGAVISSGMVLMEIVPNDEDLIIVGAVRVQDIVSVRIGQAAKLRFSAFSVSSTPAIDGEVIHIAADQAEGNYVVKIKPDQSKLDQLGLDISTGMPVEIMLTAGERTLAQYILKNFSDAISRTFKNPS